MAEKLNSPLGAAYKQLVLKDPLDAAPLLLSQARVAMIFAFEKQYSVDLARLTAHLETDPLAQPT